MRISSQVSVDVSTTKSVQNSDNDKIVVKHGNANTFTNQTEQTIVTENDFSKEKLQQAVDSLNEVLDIDQRKSRFVLHEGLNRYFVQLVDSETEEVVKEIPPKKLLDAFYEMQKLVGKIVDEKI